MGDKGGDTGTVLGTVGTVWRQNLVPGDRQRQKVAFWRFYIVFYLGAGVPAGVWGQGETNLNVSGQNNLSRDCPLLLGT